MLTYIVEFYIIATRIKESHGFIKKFVCILICAGIIFFKFVLIRGTESPPFFLWISGSKLNKK